MFDDELDQRIREARETSLPAEANNPARRSVNTALVVGLGLQFLSLIWCLAYYAAWDDAFFGSLSLKLFCVSGATHECAWAARDIIAPSGSRVPTYYPMLWWLGFGTMTVGLMQVWRNGRNALAARDRD